MRLGMIIDYSGGFEAAVEELADYEAAGLDLIAIPEAYSFDAVSQLGYIAARTKTMELASAILQLYTRTPSLTAMTAAGLDHVSGGRFTLGLGASGPQVIEGFHGVRYDAPLARTREVIEICRKVWQREPVIHEGKHYQIPLPAEQGTGLGKPLKIINRPVRQRIPISVAAIGPKNVELVAELAESWQPLFFHPGKKDTVWGESLEAGLAKRPTELGRLDIMLQVNYAFGDPDPSHLQRVRDQIALYVGGMGARGKNFYNSLATRYGYAAEATAIQDLYLAGKKAEAAAAVPDELLHAVSLLGDEEHLRARVADFKAAGVTTFLLNPLGDTPERRLADVAKLAQIVSS